MDMSPRPDRQPPQPEALGFAGLLRHEAETLRRGERTRAALLLSTCRLLDRNQPGELTVSNICAGAGIAHGTFYLHFADRHAIVADVLLAFIGYLLRVMRQSAKAEAQDRVRATTAAYYDLFEQNPGLMKCLVNHLESFPEARDAFHQLNHRWNLTVVEAVERHRARDAGAARLPRDELMRRAYALGGMIDQYLSALLLSRDPTLVSVSRDRDAVIDTLSLIWKRGMEG